MTDRADVHGRHGSEGVPPQATARRLDRRLPRRPGTLSGPVARVSPATIRDALPAHAPEHGEPFDAIFADFERVILPGVTHWNHPGFFAYFAITGSAPGVLAEFLSAALNQQAMLWRTSPAATELEEVALGWLRQLMGLPDAFEGVIYDTASVSTLHALAAAREAAVPDVRARGLAAGRDLARLRVYCSEHAHSSVDKAVILLGLGHDSAARIPADAEFRDAGRSRWPSAIARRPRRGLVPMAVVATVGTHVDHQRRSGGRRSPRSAQRERIWLHVDAAYAGVAAMVPGWRMDSARRGRRRLARRQSAQVAVHAVRSQRALLPPHGRRPPGLLADARVSAARPRAGSVRNLMDTGIQLGRRFRALKLWMILRHFGAEGSARALVEHMRLARAVRGVGRRQRSLRARRAGALQRRLLPLSRADADDERAER